jgi:3-hydroxybutyrate dehydrogenase
LLKVVYCQADFSNPELAAKKIVEKCVQVFGTVDILGKRRQFALPYIRSVVNNAGIQHVCPVDEFPTDMWNTLMNINLNGPFHCIKYNYTTF